MLMFQNISLIETSLVGKRISLPVAFDPDKADNGTISSYRLESSSDMFAVASEDGAASLYLTSQLDYEVQATHELHLLAFDSGQPSRYEFSISQQMLTK